MAKPSRTAPNGMGAGRGPVDGEMADAGRSNGSLEGECRQNIAYRCTETQPPRNCPNLRLSRGERGNPVPHPPPAPTTRSISSCGMPRMTCRSRPSKKPPTVMPVVRFPPRHPCRSTRSVFAPSRPDAIPANRPAVPPPSSWPPHPLTAPWVNPATRCFCRYRNNPMTGKLIRKPAAAIWS